MNQVLAVDRQGGGSACNMAIDLKRLDPDFPVETMGVIGDDDDGPFSWRNATLRHRARRAASLARRRDDQLDAFNVAGERPAHAFLSIRASPP